MEKILFSARKKFSSKKETFFMENQFSDQFFKSDENPIALVERSDGGFFVEFSHFHHKAPPRGPSVQILGAANLLSWAIIFGSDPTTPKF